MAKQSSSAKNHDHQPDHRKLVQNSSDGHRLEAPNPWPKPPEKANPPEAKGKQQTSDK
jgi:hypothetical protein